MFKLRAFGAGGNVRNPPITRENPPIRIRPVAAFVGCYAGALAVARGSDLVATVSARHSQGLRAGMVAFDLPFDIQPVTVSLLWHPRLDADPAHRWLRGLVRAVCGDDPLAETDGSVHS